MTTPLKKVIRKLDLIDGRPDGRYTNLSLHVKNATGACEVTEIALAAAKRRGLPIKGAVTTLYNASGKLVTIDCAQLVKKLNVLVSISSKIPATRFMAYMKKRPRRRMTLKIPTAQDFFGRHIVDHIIVRLLYGMSSATESYRKLFNYVTYKIYSKSVRSIGKQLKQPSFKRFNVTSIAQTYKLFRKLGKKYTFKTAPFKPRKSKP